MRSFLYYVALILFVMLTSCHDERNNGGGDIIGPSENGMLTVTFTMDLPSQSNGMSTYAKTENDENAISEVDVLAFKHSGGEQYYAYRVKATSITDVTSSGSQKTLKAKVEESNDTYTFVLLANIGDEINALGTIATTEKKEDVLATLIHTHPDGGKWDITKPFPMWGETGGLVITAGTSSEIKVSMIRLIARLDVLSMVATDIFEMSDIYVYNPHTHGHVVPDAANFDTSAGKAIAATIPSLSSKSATAARYQPQTSEYIREIYLYESEATDVHLEKTCLVIGGYYKGAPDPTYYRVDLVDAEGKDIHLLRNHWYTVRIVGVEGDGYEDPDPAFEHKPINIMVEMEWSDGGIHDYVFNGQYFLGVSESEIHMPAAAGDTSIMVTTNYPGCWQPTFDPATDWLHQTGGSCTGPEKKEELKIHLDENTGDTQRIGYIYIKAGPLTHVIKVYQDIAEKDEELDDVIWLTDEGEANCYILDPDADGIVIPVSQANKDGMPRIDDDDELEVELLWTDTPYPLGHPNCVIRYIGTDGQGNTGSLKVAANKGIYGNALVAVKVNGKIRWSWHIWVLSYDPEDKAIGFPTANPEIIIMDRNLGAMSADPGDPKNLGLLYQWGRKDPFPGLDGYATTAGAFKIYDADGIETGMSHMSINTMLVNMLEPSVEAPVTFIRGNTATSVDWYTNGFEKQDDTLWEQRNGDVSPYDPCPAGWTIDIPKTFWDSNAWRLDFTFPAGSYGGEDAGLGFWTLGGFLTADGTFDLSEVGRLGYYWTGVVNGFESAAIKLGKDANYNGVSIGHPISRAAGLSVRCRKK